MESKRNQIPCTNPNSPESSNDIKEVPSTEGGSKALQYFAEIGPKTHLKVHDDLKGKKSNQKLEVEMFKNNSSNEQYCTGFTRERLIKVIIRFICLTGSSWTISDKNAFVQLLRYCAQKDIDVPGSKAIIEGAKRIFEEMKVKLRQKFASVHRASLTVDTWSIEDDIALFGVTVQWIDEKWKLCKQVLVIWEIIGKHSGESISDILLQALEDFGLQSKVCAVTMDNTSKNKKMMRDLVEKLKDVNPQFSTDRHVPCLAHVINLVVQASWKNLCILPPPPPVTIFIEDTDAEDIEESFEAYSQPQIDSSYHRSSTSLGEVVLRVRELINAICISKQKLEKYTELCNTLGMPESKKLLLDCRMRWNSTYAMLVTAHAKRQVLDTMAMCFISTPTRNASITLKEWNMLKDIIDIMGPLHDVGKFASKSKMPTITEVIVLVNALTEHFNTVISKFEGNEIFMVGSLLPAEQRVMIHSACIAMKTKLAKCTTMFMYNKAFSTAAILDPSMKLVVIDPMYHTEVLCYLRGLLDDTGNRDCSSEIINIGKQSSRNVLQAQSTSNFITEALQLFRPRREQMPWASRTKELDAYLNAPCCEYEDDPLSWWRRAGKYYFPKLAMIAKEFMSVCTSNASSEQFFFLGDGIAKYKRLRLNTESIEMLVILKCWMRSDEGESDDDNDDDDDEYEKVMWVYGE